MRSGWLSYAMRQAELDPAFQRLLCWSMMLSSLKAPKRLRHLQCHLNRFQMTGDQKEHRQNPDC
jgi:hypothetical protein